jgi:hypothetical protein
MGQINTLSTILKHWDFILSQKSFSCGDKKKKK